MSAPMLAVGVSLAEAIPEVERALADLKAERCDLDDWEGYRARRYRLLLEIVPRLARRAGAVISPKWDDGASIRCAGIRSTSTSGVEGALGNWLVAARKKGVAA